MSYLRRAGGVILLCLLSVQALAWGARGHQSIGAIADAMIAGSNAETRVRALLGPWSLSTAAVWADCAKGVVRRSDGYVYAPDRHYPECAAFETPAAEAEMADYVSRNDLGCHPGPGDESCHRQYHYSDIAWQRGAYRSDLTGASDHDVVAATTAAIGVLRGAAAPAPLDIASAREALLLLSHLVGDLHQPLHVGAVYLDADGGVVDPDRDGDDPATHTRGGNDIRVGSRSLHAMWDAVPERFGPGRVSQTLLPLAWQVGLTDGDVTDWPRAWADESVAAAAQAFAGFRYGPRVDDGRAAYWPASLPDGYAHAHEQSEQLRLARAGARLAQLLQALWP